MSNESYTLIVVPDQHSEVKRIRLTKTALVRAAAGAIVFVAAAVFASVHYVSVARDAHENSDLRDENLALKGELKAIREQLEHIGGTLERVERFDQKLRAMTLLSDPQRNLALGPTEEPKQPGSAVGTNPFVRPSKDESPRALNDKLDKISAGATRQEQSLQELQAYFREQHSLLASAPSIWPVRGYPTSEFGQRNDPYTAEQVMHAGLDIAGRHGDDIIAPSDGTVVFAGLEGGYGNVLVLDHGYGIKTRYGHLSAIHAKAGERVKRGQMVASMGNTGRSTGPHLHYEIRVNGVPQNPRKFILDE